MSFRLPKRVRIRSVIIDTSSLIEPRLRYVYHDARTHGARGDRTITVTWDTGGLSAIPNDDNVTWLDDDE